MLLNTTFIIMELITLKYYNVKKKAQEGVYIRYVKHNILYMSVLKEILEAPMKIHKEILMVINNSELNFMPGKK
jgi:hypothetical protein